MNNIDRIDILKEVARVAPKEMGAKYESGVVNFYGPGMDDGDRPPQLGLEDDLCDASACFAMINAMEAVNACGELCPENHGHYEKFYEYRYCIWAYPGLLEKDRRPWHDQEFYGKMRSEAIARAFIAVFVR